MTLIKSARRRLSLLAGSSLLAASLPIAVAGGAMAIPGAALAQATCAPAPTSGNGTNDVLYGPGTYNPGIACTYTGTASEVSTTGAITVSNAAGGTGIDLTATGSNAITWDSTLGTTAEDARVTGGNFTNGPVIDATTASGDITIRVDAISGSANSATAATNSTHGIRAISTNGGDITVQSNGFISSGGTSGTSPPGIAAIEARSLGGGDVVVQASSTGGRLYGVLAETTGSGTLTIQAGGTVDVTSGRALVDATTGTGLLTLNVSGGSSSSAAAGSLVRTHTGGDAIINVTGSGRAGGLVDWAVDLDTGGLTTLNIGAELRSGGGSTYNRRTIRGQGAGRVEANISAELKGTVNFADLSGGAEFNILDGGAWRVLGESQWSDGDDTVFINEGGRVLTGSRTLAVEGLQTAIDFAGGTDLFDNAGLFVVNDLDLNQQFTSAGVNRSDLEAEVRLTGLSRFVNSGLIVMGGLSSTFAPGVSDRSPDDVLSMPGAAFVGEDGEIIMDVRLGVGPQNDCTTRDVDGDLAAGDCLMLVGGSTEGRTFVTLVETTPGDRGGYDPDGILLVDVSGGTSAQGHFVIGPNTANYNPMFGGVLDKGIFFYPIAYDEDLQQHKLVGLPAAPPLQFTLYGQVAHDLWRTSLGNWFDRQADLRDGLNSSPTRGVWLRATAEFSDRDVVQAVEGAGQTFAFDNTFRNDSYAVTGGFDLISADTQASAFVVGLMAGYGHSEVTFDQSVNTALFDAFTGGIYASYLAGGFYVDAALNGNVANMDTDIPALNLQPVGSIVSTEFRSVGAQVETGWRWPLSDQIFVEPLASLSWVRTEFDTANVRPDDASRPGVLMEYDDPVSLRGAVGARLGMSQDLGAFRAQYSLLGRAWHEFEGETNVTLMSVGPDATVGDEFGGTISELGLGVSLMSEGGIFSGFLNVGGKWGDDYEAQKASVGVRVHW